MSYQKQKTKFDPMSSSDGRSLKWLSIVDEYTQECLALEARRGMTAEEIGIILAKSRPVAAARRVGCGATTGRSSSLEVVQSWLKGTGSGSLYVARRVPGRTAMRSRFTARSATVPEPQGFESEPQARALGASGKGSIIPNVRTVPWDIRHRPKSRPLV